LKASSQINKALPYRGKTIHIYFDLDETILDEVGVDLRPGIRSLLEKLTSDGHKISLWSASTQDRGLDFLSLHGLATFFRSTVFRDDYDPGCEGHPKDIRFGNGDMLVDNDLAQVEFVQSIGKQGLHVASYSSKSKTTRTDDSLKIYSQITQKAQGG
jgi:hypothetical protein